MPLFFNDFLYTIIGLFMSINLQTKWSGKPFWLGQESNSILGIWDWACWQLWPQSMHPKLDTNSQHYYYCNWQSVHRISNLVILPSSSSWISKTTAWVILHVIVFMSQSSYHKCASILFYVNVLFIYLFV